MKKNTSFTSTSFINWIIGAMSAFGFMASSAIIAISLSNAPALANIDGKNLAADAPPHTELINIDWSAETWTADVK